MAYCKHWTGPCGFNFQVLFVCVDSLRLGQQSVLLKHTTQCLQWHLNQRPPPPPPPPQPQVKHSTTEPPLFSTSQFARTEPLNDKTNKNTYVSCKESDQPGHLPSLTSLGSLHEQIMSPELPIECTYKTCPTDMISMRMRVLDALLVLLVLSWVSSYMGNSIARTL